MISITSIFEMPMAPAPMGKFEAGKNFIIEKFRKPAQKDMVKEGGKPMYRAKKLASGKVLTFAIKNKKGPQGGRTQLVNVKRPK